MTLRQKIADLEARAAATSELVMRYRQRRWTPNKYDVIGELQREAAACRAEAKRLQGVIEAAIRRRAA